MYNHFASFNQPKIILTVVSGLATLLGYFNYNNICIVLYCISLFCIVLLYGFVLYCCMVLYCIVLLYGFVLYCSVVLYFIVLLFCILLCCFFCILLYFILLYFIVLYFIVLYFIVLYFIVLYFIVLYFIILYFIVLYFFVLYFIDCIFVLSFVVVLYCIVWLYRIVLSCCIELFHKAVDFEELLFRCCVVDLFVTSSTLQSCLSNFQFLNIFQKFSITRTLPSILNFLITNILIFYSVFRIKKSFFFQVSDVCFFLERHSSWEAGGKCAN